MVGLLLDDGETETVGLEDDHFGLGWKGRGLRKGFLFEVEESAQFLLEHGVREIL